MNPTLLVGLGALAAAALLGFAGRSLLRRPAPIVEEAPVVPEAPPPTGTIGPRIAALAAPTDEAARSALRRDLVQAGLGARGTLERFLLARAAAALLAPALGLLLVRPDRPLVALWTALVSAALGYYLPALWLRLRRSRRQASILRALPNALDMMVSCLESGLGLDTAMRRVANEVRTTAPELAAEFQVVFDETIAGVPRSEALRHLDLRTGLPDISSLVNVMGDAEKYGAGIAASIRAHAQLSRRRRALEIEKRAARAAPKLTVAMVLFVFPALFIVLLGPTVVQLFERVLPAMVIR